MKFFKPYSSIKDFLRRFTILKIGNLHIRLHKIVDMDQSTLFHNHPFNYISIILKGGYSETYIKDDTEIKRTHGFLSVIKRSHNVYHRIDSIKGKTITLFIAYGKYNWNAYNTEKIIEYGLYEREINGRKVWSKKENGIWFIGNENRTVAENETRHSIHQIIK